MTKPKISVIMSVHNAERYLEESIKSILDQTYKNFEFLIVNDGSWDKSDQIISSFIQKDKRIKYFKKKKNGLTKSLNFLLKQSKAPLIARQDADDVSDINRLKLQYNFFKKNKKCVLLGTNGYKIDENGKIYKKIKLPLKDKSIRKRLLINNSFIHSSTMIKKEKLKKINFYDEYFTYSQDYDCWCRLAFLGKIYNLRENLIKLRMHKMSLSTKKIGLQNFYACEASIRYYANSNFNNKESYRKIIFFLKGRFLPKKYIIHFSNLTFLEKINLLKFPKELIKRLLFR